MEARCHSIWIWSSLVFAGLLLCFSVRALALDSPQLEDEPPRNRALLEQAWSAESGEGYSQDIYLALMLYCHAGLYGSSEGYYRIGRVYAYGPSELRDEEKARGYFALASQLGHEHAAILLDDTPAVVPVLDDCTGFEGNVSGRRFDLTRYIAGLPSHKQPIAELIRSEAHRQHIPVSLALAVACAESNLDAHAVSPRNAQGVMQLIPDTQQRFGVTHPFDAQQNIRGGVRYLKWLLAKFDGNISHAVAAYNAGEGTVHRYRGIPPFAETRAYVRRVLFFSGLGDGLARRPAMQ
jgi:hypothetical protein